MTRLSRCPRRPVHVVAAGVGLALLVACGSDPGPSTGVAAEAELPALTAADVTREAPTDVRVDALVDGVRMFGHELAATSPVGENLVISPASIAIAFAMAEAGARGNTAQEINDVLHFPSNLHDAMNRLDQELSGGDAVQIANAIFVQSGVDLEPGFVDRLGKSYGSAPGEVHFDDGSAKQVIDAWVQAQTNDKIDELFETLPARTRIVLANAVHLRSAWDVTFTPQAARPGRFTRADGSVVDLDVIGTVADLRTATVDGVVAVEVPLARGDLVMQFLLPPVDASVVDLLDPAVLDAVGSALEPRIVGLTMPRLDLATDLPLIPALGSLGLTTAFTPAADFSGMTQVALFIDQAVHRATLSLDEHGVEAAAVTGLAFAESAGPLAEVEVALDRPFAFVVLHAPTGLPVFMGQVHDPTAV